MQRPTDELPGAAPVERITEPRTIDDAAAKIKATGSADGDACFMTLGERQGAREKVAVDSCWRSATTLPTTAEALADIDALATNPSVDAARICRTPPDLEGKRGRSVLTPPPPLSRWVA